MASPGPLILCATSSPQRLTRGAVFTRSCRRSAARASMADPLVLLPNPYLSRLSGLDLGRECRARLSSTPAEATGHLPDLDVLARQPDVLARTVAFYLCSPANPQGAVASRTTFARRWLWRANTTSCCSSTSATRRSTRVNRRPAAWRLRRARPKDSRILSSSIRSPSARICRACARASSLVTPISWRHWLRCAISLARRCRASIQQASVAVWSEEQHVAVIRQAYRAKFDICDEVLKGKFCYKRPAGGFFLWFDLSISAVACGDGNALETRGCQGRPRCLSGPSERDGINPGEQYIRVALVHDAATIREALQRIVSVDSSKCTWDHGVERSGYEPRPLLPQPLEDRLIGGF